MQPGKGYCAGDVGGDLERVRRGIESVDAFWAMLDDYVAWDPRGIGAAPDLDSVHVGRDAVIKASRHYWGTWDDYRVEAEELLDAGPSVVVIMRERGRGKSSGTPFDRQHPQLWTFRGDRIIRWESFRTRAEALEAAGLSE
ncbi:MAG: nuclear transport factor 2 family protein [Solirubrobacterales bacterium]